MPEVPPDSTLKAAARAPGAEDRARSDSAADGAAYVVASHHALFHETPASRCDACGESIADGDPAPGGYGAPGHGVYLWARGDETRLETVPLCTACAATIGMTALARWEIEEEEG
ncbi:MAG TPA: hypothetical protein VH044_12520 [Polyangiaceae bacterium]|jgi:hypothetical protein|nr:hypothetical protein [Polyangiaceae bacterium]